MFAESKEAIIYNLGREKSLIILDFIKLNYYIIEITKC
jgi:hypothetical protein